MSGLTPIIIYIKPGTEATTLLIKDLEPILPLLNRQFRVSFSRVKTKKDVEKVKRLGVKRLPVLVVQRKLYTGNAKIRGLLSKLTGNVAPTDRKEIVYDDYAMALLNSADDADTDAVQAEALRAKMASFQARRDPRARDDTIQKRVERPAIETDDQFINMAGTDSLDNIGMQDEDPLEKYMQEQADAFRR